MFVVKFQNGDDIRRVSLDGAVSLKEVTELAHSLFKEVLPAHFTFKYKDDEGDLVTLGSDRELEEAFRLFKDQGILRLVITPLAQPQPKPQQQPKSQPSAPASEPKSALEDLVDTFSPYIEALETQLNEVFPKIEEQFKGVLPKIEEQLKEVIPKVEETFAQAFQKPEVIHPAICDGCNERIRGIRYKCTQCPDYDLCAKCNQLKVHSEHLFQQIEKPVYKCSGAVPRRCASAPAQTSGQEEVQIPLRVVSQETIPLTLLRVVQPAKEEAKKEEPKKEEPKKEAPKIPETKPLTPLRMVQPAKEEPKKEEPKKEEPKKEDPFEAKLQQLEEMGFLDRQRNLQALTKSKGDMIAVVMELLE